MPRKVIQFDPDRSRKSTSSSLTFGLNGKFLVIDRLLKQFKNKVKPFLRPELPTQDECNVCIRYLQAIIKAVQDFDGAFHKAIEKRSFDGSPDYYSEMVHVCYEAEQISKLTRKVDDLHKHIVLYVNYPRGRKQEHAKVFEAIKQIEHAIDNLPQRWR